MSRHPLPKLPLNSKVCGCPTCGLVFTVPDGFERHRVGTVGQPDRRCLTPTELTERGWGQNKHGRWTRRPMLERGAMSRLREISTDQPSPTGVDP